MYSRSTTTGTGLAVFLFWAFLVIISWAWGFHEIDSWTAFAGWKELGFWASSGLLLVITLVTRRAILGLCLVSLIVRLLVGA